MIQLSEIKTDAPKKLKKENIKTAVKKLAKRIGELQNIMYAQKKYSVLVVLQGMDASGKDGVVTNVFGDCNPSGTDTYPFKKPNEDEFAHDFLWRCHKLVPRKGNLMIFVRSHYEDILIQRVHKWIDEDRVAKRMKAINDFEQLLQEHNHTHILKFYLHISPEEQHERLSERMKDPAKMWKYNEKDFDEAKLWDLYMQMYEDCFNECNRPEWTIVPADQNWYKEFVIASALHSLLSGLGMQFPGLKK